MKSIHKEHIHLLQRLTFGPQVSTIDQYLADSTKVLVRSLFEDSRQIKKISGFGKKFNYSDKYIGKGLSAQTKHKKKMKRVKQQLNKVWLEKMAFGNAQMAEKMAFFWHDHFATDVPNPMKMLEMINILRKYALGSFSKLLEAIAKCPAMIDYLNNKENIKGHPNENFAREILELFTLGEGNYSESDILEASRAFTGWTYDSTGQFYIDAEKHDSGEKVFMGHRGFWDGNDIIRILLEDKRTVSFIVSKIYFFLAGTEISNERLEELVPIFYERYHIKKLIKKIINHADFFSEDKLGTRVKSPIELLVGTMRLMNVRFQNNSLPYKIQLKLDQTLLSPPNVSGWCSGKEWINLSTIGDRLNLARNLYLNNIDDLISSPKISLEGDDLMEKSSKKYEGIDSDKLANIIAWVNIKCNRDLFIFAELIFACDLEHIRSKIEALNAKYNKGVSFEKDAVIQLFSFPEYQMN